MKKTLLSFLLFAIPLLCFSLIGCGVMFYDDGDLTGNYLGDSKITYTNCSTAIDNKSNEQSVLAS